jgi:hypothetical protein
MLLGLEEITRKANVPVTLQRKEWREVLVRFRQIKKHHVVTKTFQRKILKDIRIAIESELKKSKNNPLMVYLTPFEEGIVESLVSVDRCG